MKLTLKELRALEPCEEGLEWYEANIKTEELSEILTQLDKYEPDWARWLYTHLMSAEQHQRLALFAAKLVLPIFETRYPDDSRVRDCIETTEDYLEGNATREELREKSTATYAASYAYYGDAHAAYAAYAAAYAASYAADADVAADAAGAAAADAADAAADADVASKEKITQEALRILENGLYLNKEQVYETNTKRT